MSSKWTMETHYSVNHQGYVTRTNELLKERPKLQKMRLAMLLTQVKGPLFDQAAQHFSHVLWWFSLVPTEKKMPIPSPRIARMLKRDFGSIANWQHDFIQKAKSQFGSGWCWLCYDNGKLINLTTANAGIPNFFNGRQPLLICDLWEHAYFCDWTTDREDFIKGFFHAINWKMAEVRLNGEDALFHLC